MVGEGGKKKGKGKNQESTLFLGAAPIRAGGLTRPHWWFDGVPGYPSPPSLDPLVIGIAVRRVHEACYCCFLTTIESGH